MKAMAPVLACVALPLWGCVNERVYVDPETNLDVGGGAIGASGQLNVFDGALRGDFGPRRGFEGSATQLEGYSDPTLESAMVTVSRSEPDKGTGMIIMLTSGLVLEDLADGVHDFRFDPNSFDMPPVTVSVCSGPDSTSIDYDLPADEVTVLVTQTPEGRAFDIHTETNVVDVATGERTGAVETSDSSFLLGSAR